VPASKTWKPFYTSAEPQADGIVDAALLGTIDHGGRMMVTYNGWPLYHFAKDENPGDTRGQDIETFGGEWTLVTPAGDKAEKA
jgi:predicted lipoprotein with Yx(FWY)xxD motif